MPEDQTCEDVEYSRTFDIQLNGVSQQDIGNLADGLEEIFRPDNKTCDNSMRQRLKSLRDMLCKACLHADIVLKRQTSEAANDESMEAGMNAWLTLANLILSFHPDFQEHYYVPTDCRARLTVPHRPNDNHPLVQGGPRAGNGQESVYW